MALIWIAWKFVTFFWQMTQLHFVITSASILLIFVASSCWFMTASGLRINLIKSSIVSMAEVDNAHVLAGILGCVLDSLHSSYLEVPFGAC